MHIGDFGQNNDVHKYWDNRKKAFCIKLMPGDYYYTSEHEYIATTLGSCVSACIWDEKNNIGGMNHFMLPLKKGVNGEEGEESIPESAARYGNYAMEFLINELITHGGEKKHFKTKLFGGGKIIEGLSDIGKKNIDFIVQYLNDEGMSVVSQDLGNDYARQILFDPLTGRAWMKRVVDEKQKTLVSEEDSYRKDITEKDVSGDVDLF